MLVSCHFCYYISTILYTYILYIDCLNMICHHVLYVHCE